MQLGIPYGIGHWKDHLMPKKEAFRILANALDQNINTLDTSPEYGVAEKRIAEFMIRNPEKNFHIISKIKSVNDDENLYIRVRDIVRKNPIVALKNCSSFSLLLHSEADISRSDLVSALDELVASGEISQWGVSLYDSRNAEIAAKIEGCKIVQLPFGFLNPTFGRDGYINMLWLHGKLVHCRSVFTKGLLFNTDLSGDPVGFSLKKFFSLAIEKGVSPASLALSFVISTQGVASAVVGVDRCLHLKDLDENALLKLEKADVAEINDLAKHAILDNVRPEKW